jgi:hypothetical protein
VVKALDAAVNDPAVRDVSAEIPTERPEWGLIIPPASDERPSWGARRADALGRIAESFLQHGAEDLNSGDRQQIVIHVDAETLADSTAGRCELEEGPSLTAETVRRLACDASVITLLEDERREPLNVGRKTRSIPPALRRALKTRDRGCRFPGCPNTRYVDGHHIHHWAKGGETKLSNLVQLCRFHHRSPLSSAKCQPPSANRHPHIHQPRAPSRPRQYFTVFVALAPPHPIHHFELTSAPLDASAHPSLRSAAPIERAPARAGDPPPPFAPPPHSSPAETQTPQTHRTDFES